MGMDKMGMDGGQLRNGEYQSVYMLVTPTVNTASSLSTLTGNVRISFRCDDKSGVPASLLPNSHDPTLIPSSLLG